MRPDALVYFMCLNDIGDSYARHGGGGSVEASRPGLFSGMRGRLRNELRRSALWSFADTKFTLFLYRTGVLELDPAKPQFSGLLAAFGGVQWSDGAWTGFLADVDALAGIAQGARIPFVIAQFPYRFMLDGTRERLWGRGVEQRVDPFEKMGRHAAEHGYGWIDLRAAFNRELAARRAAGKSYEPMMNGLDFVHPSVLGHQVTARALAEYFLTSHGGLAHRGAR